MNILIIGGTKFLGPAIVDAALARDHRLTLFNRGITGLSVNAAVESIIGDRETDLGRLAGRRWDAVIDTCGYLPRLARLSAETLAGSVGRYLFISTLSVYPPAGAPRRDESADVLSLADECAEVVNGETYGPLKALCERVVRRSFPGSSVILRSGLIVGSRDPTNRFTYWMTRIARGGDVIAPPAEQPLQFIDVRDIADFTLRLLEAGEDGVFNVTGPAKPITFGQLLPLAAEALGSDARFHYASDAFLRQNGVGEFMEMPLWVNAKLAEGFMTFDIKKALRRGLSFRPLEETIKSTWAWARHLPDDIDKPADLPPAKERALLAAWLGGAG